MPVFYWRFVDKILSKMPDVSSASVFLSTPSEIHPSLSFRMELENNDKLPFLGMMIIRNSPLPDTKVWMYAARIYGQKENEKLYRKCGGKLSKPVGNKPDRKMILFSLQMIYFLNIILPLLSKTSHVSI